MVTLTYFVHSTTTDNENGLATGWLPGKLSPVGRKQASQLGELTADQHFDVVFCSDLQRAVESARLGFGDKYQIVTDSRLRECNYGDLDGCPKSAKNSIMKQSIDTPFPGGESYRDVEARLASFCDFLKQNHNGKNVAIIAHEAPQLALDVLLQGKSWPQAMNENWRHTGGWQPGWDYIIP